MNEPTLKGLIDRALSYAKKPLDPILDLYYNRSPEGYDYDYYRLAYFLAKEMQPEVIVELGTQYAQCTAHFAAGAPNARVVTIDHLDAVDQHPLFRRDALEHFKNIELLHADTADPLAAESFEDGTIGICFSDAHHTTEHVMKEVGVWTPKMKEGAVWLFDDFLLMPDLMEKLPFDVKGLAPGLHLEPEEITGRPDLLFGYAIVEKTSVEAEDLARLAEVAQSPLGIPRLDQIVRQDPTCVYYRFLYHLIHEFQLADCVELGVAVGRGTIHMAAANPAATVYAVDPHPHELYEETTQGYSNIKLIRGGSTDPEVLAQVPDESIALCFVDSVHDPDYTLQEVELWTPKLRPGGIFLFDDLAYSVGMPRVIPEIPLTKKGPLGHLHFSGFGWAMKEGALLCHMRV